MGMFSFAIGSTSRKRFTRPRRQAAQNRAQTGHFFCAYEILETRSLLTTLSVLNAADSGAGSLRDAIAAANSGDKIVFDPGLKPARGWSRAEPRLKAGPPVSPAAASPPDGRPLLANPSRCAERGGAFAGEIEDRVR